MRDEPAWMRAGFRSNAKSGETHCERTGAVARARPNPEGAVQLLGDAGESHVRNTVQARILLVRARVAQHRHLDVFDLLDDAALLDTHPQATSALRERLDAARRELDAARHPPRGIARAGEAHSA